MLQQYLQNLGLSEKEASVYIALLQVDNTSASELAQKTDIKRPTVYVMLESLEEKGLVSETTEGKRTRYQAEPPERLETYVQRRKQELEEQSKRLEDDVIPQLKSMQKEEGERPVVKYFEGKEGIISTMEEFFYQESEKEPGVMRLMYPNDRLNELFTAEDRKKYRSMRLEKNIASKVLYTSDTEYKGSNEYSERVKLDQEQYPISCDISIYRDKVRISILGEKLSGIFIRSKDFADTLRSLFDLAFDSQEKEPRE